MCGCLRFVSESMEVCKGASVRVPVTHLSSYHARATLASSVTFAAFLEMRGLKLGGAQSPARGPRPAQGEPGFDPLSAALCGLLRTWPPAGIGPAPWAGRGSGEAWATRAVGSVAAVNGSS